MKIDKIKKLHDIMKETSLMFHSYNSHEDQYYTIREIIENIAHEHNGKIFSYSLNQYSIRITYVFEDKVDNLLFRYGLYSANISYLTTGYLTNTHIILLLVDFDHFVRKFVV